MDDLIEFVSVEHYAPLVRCSLCGCIIESTIRGQGIHNTWHEKENGRISRIISDSGIGEYSR